MAHILVIEDDFKIRDIIKTYLKTYGHTYVEASNGREGLALWEPHTFEVVLLDVMMPELDGWTVLRTIRETSNVPIILLTARDQERDKLFGFELGVDDYLVKPFSPKELMARIQVALRRNGAKEVSDQLVLGPIRIDLRANQVYREEVLMRLSPKEYDLLIFLAQNPQHALTRQQILDGVWGLDFFGDGRTVDTHIKQLRESLGPYKHWIATVWGVGYRFEPEVRAHED